MTKAGIAVIISILMNLSLFSQNKLKEYNCYRAFGFVNIDGDVYDSVWKTVPWSDFFNDIEHPLKPEPYLQTRMKMLWDDNYLYIAAELEEDNIWASLYKHDQIIYYDNDFEVFIDPGGEGKNYFEIEVNAFETILDLFLEKPYHMGGKADLDWDAEGLKKAVKHYGVVNDTAIDDIKWTVELAIPWTCYHSRDTSVKIPENDEVWRINFSRVHWETEFRDGKYQKIKDSVTGRTLPEYNWTWSSQGVINMHVPEMWGKVVFKNSFPFRNEKQWTNDGYPKFWVWKSGSNTDFQWEKIFRTLDDAGIYGFLFQGNPESLEKVISFAKQYDISVHSWFWTMNRGDSKSEWLSVNQEGFSLANKKAYVDYYKFMCPALPEVVDFISYKMRELAKIEGLDGIHMDYIRYVDVILPVGLQPKYGLKQDSIIPEFDYGYHPYMRNLYQQEYNIDPLDIENPGNDEQWINFRLNQLDESVAKFRDYIRENGITASAAVFPTPDMSVNMVRQNWKCWNLDCYFPMVYNNFYNKPISWIGEVIREDRKNIGKSSKIFCGLYLPSFDKNHDLDKAISIAIESGADGVALFSYDRLDNDMIEQVKAFSK